MKPTRRDWLTFGSGMAAGAAVSMYLSPERRAARGSAGRPGVGASGDEEYVWLSANANLSLFVGRDHPALYQAGRDLGVKVTIAGPNTVDIPALVTAVEQTAARRPAGMMVVGWDPHALIPSINAAVESGVPVVCVDADVPGSKRLAYIGTDWTEVGVRQGEAMVKALRGRRGEVALLGLIEQSIDQQAFDGFRAVATKAGLTVLDPLQDKGNQAEATRVAAGVLQARPGLVGMAGFDSESGPGMGQAAKEAGKAGQVVLTCVETTEQHLRLVQEGVLTALIGQKRELFTYYGVKVLHDVVHSTLKLTADDRKAGVTPIPVNFNTGTFTVTRENVDAFLGRKG
jgi:ABC-type sugar transport system substrate-binding protein